MFMMLMLIFFLEAEIIDSALPTVGESGGEDSEDEWNYVKIEKRGPEGLTAVEEAQEIESPVAETKEVISEEIIPVSNNRSSRPFFQAKNNLKFSPQISVIRPEVGRRDASAERR